jgi:hypothetical protein
LYKRILLYFSCFAKLSAYIAAFFAVDEKSVGTRIVFITVNYEVKLIKVARSANDRAHTT